VRTVLIVACLAIVCGNVRTARATQPSDEGDAPFGISSRLTGAPRVGEEVSLWVGVGSVGDSTCLAQLRLRLPKGVELVAGDTLIGGQACSDRISSVLRLRILASGRHEIVCDLSIVSGVGVDETQLIITMQSDRDSGAVVGRKYTRAETVRDGQRYRYGGRYLVPIAGPEDVTQGTLATWGKRAMGPAVIETECRACVRETAVRVPVVVFVGPKGDVVGVRVRGTQPVAQSVVEVATRAVHTKTFAPAQYAGRAYADWIELVVTVTSDQ
jgi:hypothetical protein